MKIFTLLFLIIDGYIGIRFILNGLHILQTSKYSKEATLLYAVIFTLLSLVGIYFLFFKNNLKVGFLISVLPWVLILIILLLNMIFGDYR